jgi:4-hydroxy-tetrahydrodipicolinate reductase
MDITIIGYGKMGKEIEKIALDHCHRVVAKIDDGKSLQELASDQAIAIDFTQPEAFKANYKILADKFKTVIVGTTGWDDIRPEVINYFKSKNKTLIYASNFSIGVNIFFKSVNYAAKLLAKFNYDPYIIEMHHNQKLDAPSGTAKTIENILAAEFPKKVKAVSVRSGQIKGIHEVGFESEVDKITIKHEAYTRCGFAQGAIQAAEWSENITGIWDFKDLLEQHLGSL